jgi:hypothetical protein
MKNVTITLDEKVAHWARVEAAKAGKSLSRWIGERLEIDMARPENRKPTAKEMATLRSFLEGPGFPGIAANLPKRDDLYDRPALRRHESADLRRRPKRSGKA